MGALPSEGWRLSLSIALDWLRCAPLVRDAAPAEKAPERGMYFSGGFRADRLARPPTFPTIRPRGDLLGAGRGLTTAACK